MVTNINNITICIAGEFCISRETSGSKLVTLTCGLLNIPQPRAMRSWFKNDELIYTELTESSVDLSDYFMQFPILMTGVLDPTAFTATSDGIIFLNYEVDNITTPALLPPNTTLEQAREEVFDLLLGNWECRVNNTLGSATPVMYLIRECGEILLLECMCCVHMLII